MSVASPVPEQARGICPLCATLAPPEIDRCQSCGYALAGVDGRPAAFSRVTLLWASIGFFATYLVTLAIVAATR